VNSISAIINTKDMTIQVSKAQGQHQNMYPKSQNLSKKRKTSKPKNAPSVNKFEKSGKFII
jgi:hypothetical protein